MAKATHVSTDGLSAVRPVLTGDSRVDQALWILSSVLVDIANQPLLSNENRGTNTKNKIEKRIKNVRTIPVVKDSSHCKSIFKS